MSRLIWLFKQLFPFKYDSTFTENDSRKLCIWRMWFGQCFHIKYFDLA